MKRIDAGLPHNLRRSAMMMRAALLPFVVSGLVLSACSKGSEPSGVLSGQRLGERGSPCVSFMDCKAELECVDGLCGVFGESTTPRDQGQTCERAMPSGTGTGPMPNNTPGGGQATPSGPLPGTTGSPGVTTPTKTTTTTTTTTTTSSAPTSEPEPDPVPPGCETVSAEFQRAKNPYSITDAAVLQAGEALYKKRIARKTCGGSDCHGDIGAGNGYDKFSDFTTAESKARPDCIMIDHTLNGVADPNDASNLIMPAYKGKMTEDEAWKVITYIRTLTL